MATMQAAASAVVAAALVVVVIGAVATAAAAVTGAETASPLSARCHFLISAAVNGLNSKALFNMNKFGKSKKISG